MFVSFQRVRSSAKLPIYATRQSAGADVFCAFEADCTVYPNQRMLIPTGLKIGQMDRDTELQIRPKSGLALKKGLMIANSPGTIDSDYPGEIGVIVLNMGSEPITIHPGDAIAQIVVSPIVRIPLYEADDTGANNLYDYIKPEDRLGGFGSTACS